MLMPSLVTTRLVRAVAKKGELILDARPENEILLALAATRTELRQAFREPLENPLNLSCKSLSSAAA